MLTNVQIKRVGAHRHRGFSMMDVLIAILVLAVGLLALGVLQGTLTRNAADARTRSQVAAYSQGVADMLRAQGYDALTSTSVTANSTVCGGTSLTSLQTYACNWLNSTGMSSVSTAVTSTQYYGAAGGTWTTSSAGVSGSSAQYKQVNITTTWTDSQAQTRTLAYDTTVNSVTLNPSDGSLDSSSFLTSSVSPQVRESSPGSIPGVIPIAIGQTGGTNSTAINAAATNPKPVVTNTGTTFSQYTYNDSSLGGELITQRVDTKVIQCSCKYKSGGNSTTSGLLSSGVPQQPNQPTYWDGYHYVSPSQNTTVQVASSGSGSSMTYASNTMVDSSATNNDTDCDICCRDRNDPASPTTSNPVLFDSFSGDNNHYKWGTDANGNATPVVSTTTYQQACRLIRVDGVYATATDAHNSFFNFLPTDTCQAQGTSAAPSGCTSNLTASDTIPSSSTEAGYSSFVKDYLSNNLSVLSSSAGTGTGMVQTTWGSASPLTGSASSSVFNTDGLNQPTNITITLPNTVSRWMYARGLYIDHVESAAQIAIANAMSGCSATDLANDNCALQYIPFTTVNMTELANWSSTAAGVVKVSNAAIIGGDATNPQRGNVTVPSTQTGSGNPTATTIGATYVTNSGLTGMTVNQANSTYDIQNTLSDQRQFTVSGTGTTSGTVYFNIALSGVPWMSGIQNGTLDPVVGWSGVTTATGTASGGSDAIVSGSTNNYSALYQVTQTTCTKTKPNGTCQTYTTSYVPNSASPSPTPTAAAPAGLTIAVQKYNYTVSTGTGTCNATTGAMTETATQCSNLSVSSVTIGANTVSCSSTGVNCTTQSNNLSGGTSTGLLAGTNVTITPTLTGTPVLIGISSASSSSPDLITVGFTAGTTIPVAGTCSASTSQTCTGHGSNQVCTTTTTYAYKPGTCPN